MISVKIANNSCYNAEFPSTHTRRYTTASATEPMVIFLTYHIREETMLLETPHDATLWMYLINIIYGE